MTVLRLRPADACAWDLVSLGEVMLRLDPGDERIATTRSFRVWEGGGEYNVARGLARCFGHRTAIVTALADNAIGRLIEDLMRQGGVAPAELRWAANDGDGRSVRNGLNFTERGFGVRAGLGVSDRMNTAASELRPGQIDWDGIFGRERTRWLHTGGIFAALSPTTAAVAREAMEAARVHGATVSFDLNYRPSLWAASGGPQRAAEVNRELVGLANVLFGNEEDYSSALGYELDGIDDELLELDPAAYEELATKVLSDYPGVEIFACTLRQARSATVNDWAGVCATRNGFCVGPSLPGLEIYDRIGGGDSFASGFIHGMLTGTDVATALAFGVAHGALAMTTPGDTSMATVQEVERLMHGGAVRVVR